MSFGFRFKTSTASMVGRTNNLIFLLSALLRTSRITGNLQEAPVPITSWRHFQGMSSPMDSGVWPNCSRNCLDGFFLRFADLTTIDYNIVLARSAVNLNGAEGKLFKVHT